MDYEIILIAHFVYVLVMYSTAVKEFQLYLFILNRMVQLLTIGARIAEGFDFLEYSFEPKGLSIAPKTLANFLERKTQLYEQGADARRIGQYVRNWWRWVRAGVELRFVNTFIVRHQC
jgi:hypothetical protein